MTGIIAGGTGTIGSALTRRVVQEGHSVLVLGRADSVLAELKKLDESVQVAEWDCSVLDEASQRLRAILDGFEGVDHVDYLVNCIGVGGWWPIELMKNDDWRALLAANLTAPFLLTREIVGRMKPRRRGVVIHVSSPAARQASPQGAAYSATKAGLEALCEGVAVDAKGAGVRVLRYVPEHPVGGRFIGESLRRSVGTRSVNARRMRSESCVDREGLDHVVTDLMSHLTLGA